LTHPLTKTFDPLGRDLTKLFDPLNVWRKSFGEDLFIVAIWQDIKLSIIARG
jgi:hypothetical protein